MWACGLRGQLCGMLWLLRIQETDVVIVGHRSLCVPTDLGAHLLTSYLFVFSCYSWVLKAKGRCGLLFPPLVDRVLSELSTMTCSSWVALLGMAHSFIELDKAVVL